VYTIRPLKINDHTIRSVTSFRLQQRLLNMFCILKLLEAELQNCFIYPQFKHHFDIISVCIICTLQLSYSQSTDRLNYLLIILHFTWA
jgi:hypothetical protein